MYTDIACQRQCFTGMCFLICVYITNIDREYLFRVFGGDGRINIRIMLGVIADQHKLLPGKYFNYADNTEDLSSMFGFAGLK